MVSFQRQEGKVFVTEMRILLIEGVFLLRCEFVEGKFLNDA